MQAATFNGAQFLGIETQFGLIEKNRNALTPQLLNKIEEKLIKDIKQPNVQAAICAYFEVPQADLDNVWY